MNTIAILLFIPAAVVSQANNHSGAARARQFEVSHCLVALIDDVLVPARRAGVLDSLSVVEGATVAQGDILALLDSREAVSREAIAQREYDAAEKAASSDIDERFAIAAARVAQAELFAAQAANEKIGDAVPLNEVRRLDLELKRASLRIEQVELEQDVEKLQLLVRDAQLAAAGTDVGMHRIVSPLDGVAARIPVSRGEWLNPGDPVCRVVRLDEVRVEGFVDAARYTPQEIHRRKVMIVVRPPRQKPEKFTARIDFASPLVEASGEYRVWAKVTNRQRGEYWILRPGTTVEMTISLDEIVPDPPKDGGAKTVQK